MTVQSTSPYYAPKAFWCINQTLESEGFYVRPYHIQVPAFGDWGFNMASVKELEGDMDILEDTKYLTSENVGALFIFGKDETLQGQEIERNTLSKPMLIHYYAEAVRNWE